MISPARASAFSALAPELVFDLRFQEVAVRSPAEDRLPEVPLPCPEVFELLLWLDVLELLRATDVDNPLKHRDSSAAALFVKLTSADIPPDPESLVALFQPAFNTTKKQARMTFCSVLSSSVPCIYFPGVYFCVGARAVLFLERTILPLFCGFLT